jgi:hypothetical protein
MGGGAVEWGLGVGGGEQARGLQGCPGPSTYPLGRSPGLGSETS